MADTLVLCYHAVSDHWTHPMAVHPAELRRQVQSVLRKGYRPATFSAGLDRPGGRQVLITFDDGFESTHRLALPVLAELGVPATVFVPTTLITAGSPLLWDGFDPSPLSSPDELAPMSWAQVGELVASGWEVGSHSLTHPRLPELDDAALREQLVRSRRECAENTGQPCRSVAYPFGAVDRRVQDAARDAGYSWGAALGPHRARQDALVVPRTGVYRRDDARRFAVKTCRPLRTRAATTVVAGVRRTAALLPRQRTGADC